MASEKDRDDTVPVGNSRPEDSDGSTGTQNESAGMNQDEATGSGDSTQGLLEQLQQRVRELEDENSSLKDQYLRKQADFENYRKRMMREKEESAKFANSQLLQDLIPIIDDFERATKSAEDSKNFDTFHEGIAMIEKQFLSMLDRKWGLQRMESVGQPFDPERHEAVNAENRPDHDVSMVLEDYQKGYTLNERVLRPARVKVSLPVQPVTGEEPESVQ